MGTSHLPIIALAILASCSKSAMKEGDTGSQSSADAPSCEITVNRTAPVDGANDHYYLDPIVFELSAPDETAQILTDIPGDTLWSDDGRTLTFKPRDPLAPMTTYSVTLDYCYASPEIVFSTSQYGTALEASADLEGAVYMLDFTSGDYTMGDNAGELMNAVFQWPILVQLLDTDGPYLDAMAAIGEKDTQTPAQNMCARTLLVDQLSTATLPLLSGGMNDEVFGAIGGLLRFESFQFDGTIGPDALSLGGIRYEASLGVAEIADLLPDFGGEDAVCTLASNLDMPCEPCATDEFELCLRVAAEHISGIRVSTPMTPIAEAGTHPDCETEDR